MLLKKLKYCIITRDLKKEINDCMEIINIIKNKVRYTREQDESCICKNIAIEQNRILKEIHDISTNKINELFKKHYYKDI